MTRTLILAALLAGCSAPVQPPQFTACPSSVPVPARLGLHETVGQLEIRVELARLAERRRADDCADAVTARDAWIGAHQK